MTRSPNGASRSPAIHRASGSRSRPISRRPGSSVRKRSACPPAPRVASTSTAPAPSASLSGQRGRQQLDAAVEQDRDVPVVGVRVRGHRKPLMMRAPAPRSLSESADLALGKYARAGSGRGHDARARAGQRPGSNDVAQSFIGGRGEVLFVGLLVVLPGLRRPRSPGSRPIRSPRTPWTGSRSGGGRPTT